MSVKERDPFARPVRPNQPVKPVVEGEVSERADDFVPPDIMNSKTGMAKMDAVLDDLAKEAKQEETVKEAHVQDLVDSVKKASEKPKFTKEELKPILDSVMRRGYAAISVKIGTIEIILRSHYTWEDNMVMHMLDEAAKDTNLNLSMDFNRQLYSLAASLVVYDGQKFPPKQTGTKEELRKSLEDRIQCLLEMPNLIFSKVMDENVKLTQKMAAIAEDFDGIIESF